MRKSKVVASEYCDGARIGGGGVDLVHRISGYGQQEFVAVVEEGFEEHVDGFIHAVGERDLDGREAEVSGNDGFDGFALGIAGEGAGRDFAEDFSHARRAGQGVLVEVEAEGVAAAKGRMVLHHGLHPCAGCGNRLSFGLSHGTSFAQSACGSLRRGR